MENPAFIKKTNKKPAFNFDPLTIFGDKVEGQKPQEPPTPACAAAHS
jgi:hypothetical protein